MKRLKSLALILLALSMALALCACGEPETDPAEDEDTPGQSQTDGQDETDNQDNQDGQDGQDGQTQGADLEALKNQIISDYQYTDCVDVSKDALGTVYGIDTSKVVSAAAFNATVGGAFPHEVVMIQASDEAAATEMQSALTNHLNNIAEQAASYDAASQALAESCSVVVEGSYVGMFFTDNCSDMTTAFQTAVS